MSKGKDAEREIVEGFPEASVFVEKPVSTSSVVSANEVVEYLKKQSGGEGTGRVISVGYMLRYCEGVRRMKEVLKQEGLKVMMTSARYVMGECESASGVLLLSQ